MLDRTTDIASQTAAEPAAEETPRAERSRSGGVRRFVRSAWAFFVTQSFSSLTRRIVFLNLTGLVALVIGVLYLTQFRAGLIDARAQSLQVQGEIIAGAIAASATVETDSITIDPERLLELQAGESYGPSDEALLWHRIPHQPGACRAGAAPPRLADQDARAHLRPRRRAHPRQPQSLRPRRRAAFRSAAADGGKAGHHGARISSRCAAGSAAATCRSTRSSGRKTARAIRRYSRRSTACRRAWCASTIAAR